MTSDVALIEQARQGNTEAFGSLYDRYAPLIRCVCHDETNDYEAAMDLTQDVFLRAFRKIDQLRDMSKFASWLLGIARRAVIDWRRTRAKDRERFVSSQVEPGIQPANPNAELVCELREAIGQLTEKERLAVHLFYLLEHPADVARQELGLSSSGFYKLLDRVKGRLASMMTRDTR